MASPSTTTVVPKVSVGIGTIAGLVAAVLQYGAAVAVFVASDHTNAAIGALVTATVTLTTTLAGRYGQAVAAALRAAPAIINTFHELEPPLAAQVAGHDIEGKLEMILPRLDAVLAALEATPAARRRAPRPAATGDQS